MEFAEIDQAKRAIANARLSGAEICAKKELSDAEEFLKRSEVYRIEGQWEVSRFFAIKAKEMAELAELKCLQNIEEQRAYAEEAFERAKKKLDAISTSLDSDRRDVLKEKLQFISTMIKEKRYLEAIEKIINFEKEIEKIY